MNTDSQWSKQEACFACATQVWLAANHNTSVTSGECSKRIARASELDSNFVHEAMLDSSKPCFENVIILVYGH